MLFAIHISLNHSSELVEIFSNWAPTARLQFIKDIINVIDARRNVRGAIPAPPIPPISPSPLFVLLDDLLLLAYFHLVQLHFQVLNLHVLLLHPYLVHLRLQVLSFQPVSQVLDIRRATAF